MYSQSVPNPPIPTGNDEHVEIDHHDVSSGSTHTLTMRGSAAVVDPLSSSLSSTIPSDVAHRAAMAAAEYNGTGTRGRGSYKRSRETTTTTNHGSHCDRRSSAEAKTDRGDRGEGGRREQGMERRVTGEENRSISSSSRSILSRLWMSSPFGDLSTQTHTSNPFPVESIGHSNTTIDNYVSDDDHPSYSYQQQTSGQSSSSKVVVTNNYDHQYGQQQHGSASGGQSQVLSTSSSTSSSTTSSTTVLRRGSSVVVTSPPFPHKNHSKRPSQSSAKPEKGQSQSSSSSSWSLASILIVMIAISCSCYLLMMVQFTVVDNENNNNNNYHHSDDPVIGNSPDEIAINTISMTHKSHDNHHHQQPQRSQNNNDNHIRHDDTHVSKSKPNLRQPSSSSSDASIRSTSNSGLQREKETKSPTFQINNNTLVTEPKSMAATKVVDTDNKQRQYYRLVLHNNDDPLASTTTKVSPFKSSPRIVGLVVTYPVQHQQEQEQQSDMFLSDNSYHLKHSSEVLLDNNIVSSKTHMLISNNETLMSSIFDLPTVLDVDNLDSSEEPQPPVDERIEVTNSTITNPIIPSPPTSNPTNTKEDTCQPMAEWMKSSFVNCNTIHEIDVPSSSMKHDGTDIQFLGQGWFRSAWRYSSIVDDGSTSQQDPPLILKTLRIEREFLDEYYDLHRRDAVAMERLTSSPFVVDVYGYCGQSALNEYAEGIMDGQINSLEQINRRMRGRESDESTLKIKLQLAVAVSVGLAHVHNVNVDSRARIPSVKQLLYSDPEGNSNETKTGFANSMATMAHYDINPRNIAIMKGGKPKLNDFNIAEFLQYNAAENPDNSKSDQVQPCGFVSRLHEPWWRAPEEMNMTNTVMVREKVDVYALGNVLFHILTTHSPRGKMKKERMEEVRNVVRAGVPPTLTEPFASDPALKRHRIVKAFVKAMDMCFIMDPNERGSSIDVARVLHQTLQRQKERELKQQTNTQSTEKTSHPRNEESKKKSKATTTSGTSTRMDKKEKKKT